MNLAQCICEKIQRVPSDKAGKILAFDEKLRVEVKLADNDRLGCLLERLNLECAKGSHATIDPVQIERQLTYLGERLKIIETDGSEGRTILRSLPPRVEGELISYFELVLDRSKALTLVRCMYVPKLGKRVPVPAVLTRDTLERLVGDLIALVQ